MSAPELVALVCCDLGAIVRGRSLPASELAGRLAAGVGWTPANHALTPLGTLAEPNPFGSTGDLRLLPDVGTHVRVAASGNAGVFQFVLCDITDIDGGPWECCPRRFLRDALSELEHELGVRVVASFEHEFQLLVEVPPQGPFSLAAQRDAEPFAADVVGALLEAGVAPELITPEFAAHQLEIPVEPAEGLAAADRAVVFREVVREMARRHELRPTFAPLLDPAGAGNGVHIHLSLLDAHGRPLLYDAAGPAGLSELGERFAAGILLHARALSALTAPSPPSAARLSPHRWSAGAVCLAQQNREALLRIPPLVRLGSASPVAGDDPVARANPRGGANPVAGADPVASADEAHQLRLEYRGADATANPYIALGAIVRAGLDGVRAELPAPLILDRDPARLEQDEAERYGVGGLPGSLEESLRALAEDRTAREWMTPLTYEAYTSVKRAELQAMAGLDLSEVCGRYAAAY